MNKSVFNIIGWVILTVALILWLGFNYSDLNILLLPLAIISFSVANGSIQKWKQLSASQVVFIIIMFIVTIAVAIGLILGAGFLITNVFEVEGMWKNVLEWTAIIIVMVPAIILFSSAIAKVDAQLRENHYASKSSVLDNEAIQQEVRRNLETMNEIQVIKSIRKKYRLSLVEAKKIVDSATPPSARN